MRPFGLSVLVAGFDNKDTPKLFSLEPSGAFSQWKAHAIGKNGDKVLELLDKSYKDNMEYQEAMDLVISSMLEYVEAGSKNIEVSSMRVGHEMTTIPDDEIDRISNRIEEEKKKSQS